MDFKITSLPSSTATATPTSFKITSLPNDASQANPLDGFSSISSASGAASTPQAQQITQNFQSGAFNKDAGLNTAAMITQNVGEAARQTNEALTSRWSPLGWATGALGAATNAVAGAAKAVVDPLATAAGGALRSAVGAQNADRIGQAVVNNPVTQGVTSMINSPEISGAVNAVGNVANLAGTVGGAAGVAESLGDLPKALNPASPIGKAVAPVTDALQKHYVNNEIANWEKPTTIAKPSYNKATDILGNAAGKGNDIPTTLVKNRITLQNNVENGTYSTADTAEQLRADAGKASSELLRPSLQMADYSTPKTPVADILKSTIADIRKSKGMTPGDIETQITKAKSEGAALQNKYPDGMSLTDMHDNKITYAQNGKYSPIGDTNVNNIAAVNRSLGRTLGGLVEQKAPSTVPVHEFNAELSKQYQAADYLDALNGKKVPTSILSRIAKTTAKVVGASVGNGMGGGVLGGVGGYHIGGMLETMLENMPNPVKGHFLNTLEMTNPEAFNSVKNFIGEEQAAQLQRRQLPAPSPLGSSKNPITPTPPTTYDPQAPKNNYQETPKNRINIGLGIKDVNNNSVDILNAFMDSTYSALKKLEFPSTRAGDMIGAFSERDEIMKKIEDGTATMNDLHRGRELIRLHGGK